MKKFCISFLCLAIIVLSSVVLFGCDVNRDYKKEYLRIHIRANSNIEEDQAVKYLVKDKMVEFLTPYLSNVHDKTEAISLLKELTLSLEAVADKVLKERGFNYTSKVSIKSERFPLRVYGNLSLEEGIYDALIVELGSGTGDNWWCVVYPPLCFVEGDGNYLYKSKLFEIIKDFFNN